MNPSPIQTLPTELLEKILLYIPMVDLLRSQSICKDWKSLVQDSINIQRALFFAPKPQPEYEKTDREENPLLYSRFPAWIIDGENELGDKIATFIPLSLYHEGPDPMHIANPTASWRRMLLTQPPYKCIEFFDAKGQGVFEDDGNGGSKEFSERVVFRVHHVQGINMSILMREIEAAHLTELPDHFDIRHYPKDTEWVLCFRDRYSEFFTEETLKMFPDLTIEEVGRLFD